MSRTPLTPDAIDQAILIIRDHKVLLDEDLAKLYGVPTKRLNEAVQRNRKRFPDDFMFRLTKAEHDALRSQSATSKDGRGGRRYPPYAFTEQGVAMLSSVLNSARAVAVNIEIMRAFVRLRKLHQVNIELARRLDELEEQVTQQQAQNEHHFRVVFEAIRQLMTEDDDDTEHRRIGFDVD